MQYRRFGNIGVQVSALGFGTMRLPHDSNKNIKEAEAIKMIRHAIDNGVNYIDTAYAYHHGMSESLTGKALLDGYRSRVMLATKSPTWLVKTADDFDRMLDEQLQKLQTDCIDFYLLHALDKDSWKDTILKLNIIGRAEAAKKAGKIKHLGFSFHDKYDAFVEIIDGYDKWEFCQIQYNYLDIENQAGTKGLKYAASKGLGVIIMEPLLGGKLANPPEEVKELFRQSGFERTPAEWALQWIWNQPEVSVVLSGMSTMEQTVENIDSAGKSKVGLFGEKEMNTIDLVRQKYLSRVSIPCTGCSYCMPCPNNVNIPRNFELYNESKMHEDTKGSKFAYSRFMEEQTRASSCVGCKACEDNCPQKIQISEWMPKVHSLLG